MDAYQLQLIETGVVIALSVGLRFVIKAVIDRTTDKFDHDTPRSNVIKRVFNIILIVLTFGIISMIWGVNQSELLFFISSTITVLGIAFVAQWSVLSNITSSMIIFFNYPTKIGDHITILDRDYEIHGRIIDIAVFYVILESDSGEKITIPSNVFMQKMVRRDKSSHVEHKGDDGSSAV